MDRWKMKETTSWGALAVMASRPPSSKTAEATKEDRNNEQTRGTERPTCLAHEAGTAQTSAPHNVDLLRQRDGSMVTHHGSYTCRGPHTITVAQVFGEQDLVERYR